MVSVILLGLVAWPSTATAGPLEEAAQAVETQVRVVAPQVAPVVGAATEAEPVRSTVESVRSGQPVRTVVETVTGATPVRSPVETGQPPIREAPPKIEPAVAGAVDTAPVEAGPAPAARTGGRAPRSTGAIDRNASTRTGGTAPESGETAALDGMAGALASAANLLGSTPVGELPRAAASSIAASGDDGGDGLPLFGHGGGSDVLGGPGGIALLALGLLVALLTLIPRFSSRLLQMSSTRWGPATFDAPIERPG